MMNPESRRQFFLQSAGAVGLLGLASCPSRVWADDAPSAEDLIIKAVQFLRPRQAEDGSWASKLKEPGITALVVTALLRSKRVTPADPAVTKALGFLEKYVGPKGGLSEAPHSTYSTSVALMAFQEANKDHKYDAFLKGGQEFLKSNQFDETNGKPRDNSSYGGAGYGGDRSRPDLSNTAFMIEALRDSGLPADDPALQKALVFVSRCQNLKGEFNDQPWAGKVNDGGFIYTAANGGQSPGGKTPDGGFRSYAGMTYAGLKSMIYAGLKPDDPRIKAAIDFISKNYNLEENPGAGQSGLYYYYQTFAKAMFLLGKPTIVDASGKEHNWRADLVAALAKRQDPNGSWVNKADRFMEGDPDLVTAFALLALSYANTKP